MTQEQLRQLNFIVEHYGSANQLNKSIEDLSELITEISRYDADEPHHRGNIFDELSDVLVMCNQLMIIFDCFGNRLYFILIPYHFMISTLHICHLKLF